ncbi:hypothetical protein B0H14DRAFT_3423217 [Mycena olivaceomarginata]|nr:hypothetical protein B0H14DRAFT_3423217 [Mycena olivaceomarginata]
MLLVWWLKTAYTHRAPTDHTPNIRARPIFADDAPLGQPYIHNTVQNIAIPPIPVHAFQAGSIMLRTDLQWLSAGANTSKNIQDDTGDKD